MKFLQFYCFFWYYLDADLVMSVIVMSKVSAFRNMPASMRFFHWYPTILHNLLLPRATFTFNRRLKVNSVACLSGYFLIAAAGALVQILFCLLPALPITVVLWTYQLTEYLLALLALLPLYSIIGLRLLPAPAFHQLWSCLHLPYHDVLPSFVFIFVSSNSSWYNFDQIGLADVFYLSWS